MGKHRIVKWTPERLALLKETWTGGKSPDDILVQVNALPGEPIATRNSVYIKASELGLKHGCKSDTCAIAEPAAVVTDYAFIDWRGAMDWASRNRVKLGETEDQDLVATNARRIALGLPPYRIITAPALRGPLVSTHVGGSLHDA